MGCTDSIATRNSQRNKPLELDECKDKNKFQDKDLNKDKHKQNNSKDNQDNQDNQDIKNNKNSKNAQDNQDNKNNQKKQQQRKQIVKQLPSLNNSIKQEYIKHNVNSLPQQLKVFEKTSGGNSISNHTKNINYLTNAKNQLINPQTEQQKVPNNNNSQHEAQLSNRKQLLISKSLQSILSHLTNFDQQITSRAKQLFQNSKDVNSNNSSHSMDFIDFIGRLQGTITNLIKNKKQENFQKNQNVNMVSNINKNEKIKQKQSISSSSSISADNLAIQIINQLKTIITKQFKSFIDNSLQKIVNNKISLKSCKIQMSQYLIRLHITIAKTVFIHLPLIDKTKFLKALNSFFIDFIRYLKSIYPRSQKINGNQLSVKFIEFDKTQLPQYNMLMLAGIKFEHNNDDLNISNTIKMFINKIMDELDKNYAKFQKLVEGRLFAIDGEEYSQGDPNKQKPYKIGRKISQNASRFNKMHTGILQVTSSEILRILIKWMNDLVDIIKYPIKTLDPQNQYKYNIMMNADKGIGIKNNNNSNNLNFYQPNNNIANSKSMNSYNKLASTRNISLLTFQSLHNYSNNLNSINNQQIFKQLAIQQLLKKQQNIQSRIKYYQLQYQKFKITFINMLLKLKTQIRPIQQRQLEIIKFSQYHSNFIQWMIQEKLQQAIKILIEVENQIKLNNWEFNAGDSLGTNILGSLNSNSTNNTNNISSTNSSIKNLQQYTQSLIKFKVCDLMRCQYYGNKKKIISIYNNFIKLQQQGELQIIKIKNRLDSHLNDVMIFYKIKDSFLICECQLIFNSGGNKIPEYQHNIEVINHFLYQLERSPFDIIGEASQFYIGNKSNLLKYCENVKLQSIKQRAIKQLKQKQQIKQIKQIEQVKQMTKQQLQIQQFKKKKDIYAFSCQQLHPQSITHRQQNIPIICNICLKYFIEYENAKKIVQCKKCSISVCNNCMKIKLIIQKKQIMKILENAVEIEKQYLLYKQFDKFNMLESIVYKQKKNTKGKYLREEKGLKDTNRVNNNFAIKNSKKMNNQQLIKIKNFQIKIEEKLQKQQKLIKQGLKILDFNINDQSQQYYNKILELQRIQNKNYNDYYNKAIYQRKALSLNNQSINRNINISRGHYKEFRDLNAKILRNNNTKYVKNKKHIIEKQKLLDLLLNNPYDNYDSQIRYILKQQLLDSYKKQIKFQQKNNQQKYELSKQQQQQQMKIHSDKKSVKNNNQLKYLQNITSNNKNQQKINQLLKIQTQIFNRLMQYQQQQWIYDIKKKRKRTRSLEVIKNNIQLYHQQKQLQQLESYFILEEQRRNHTLYKYLQQVHEYRSSMMQNDINNGQQIFSHLFQSQPINLKHTFKSNKIKIYLLIKFIQNKYLQNRRNNYLLNKDINFVIITWRRCKLCIKCYKIQRQKYLIVNTYSQIQKYMANQVFEFSNYDQLFLFNQQFIRSISFCDLNKQSFDKMTKQRRLNNQKNISKYNKIIENGIYLFDNQQEQKFVISFIMEKRLNKEKYKNRLENNGNNEKNRQQQRENNHAKIQKIRQQQNKNKNKNENNNKNDLELIDYLQMPQNRIITLSYIHINQYFFIIDKNQSIQGDCRQDNLYQHLKKIPGLKHTTKNLILRNWIINNQQLVNIKKFEWMNYLKILDLSQSKIKNIELVLQSCSILQMLNANNNQIQELKLNRSFVHMKYLLLSNNNISKIFKLNHLKSLRVLNLNYNKIDNQFFNEQHITQNLRQQQQLKGTKKFNNNPKQNLSLGQSIILPQLQQLYLNFNQIKIFKKIFCPKLQILSINSNRLNNLTQLSQCNLMNLHELYCNQNNLQIIQLFQYIQTLRVCQFKANKISDINKFFMSNLSEIESISFNYNRIREFPNVGGLSKLITISFQQNPIEKIQNLLIANSNDGENEEFCKLNNVLEVNIDLMCSLGKYMKYLIRIKKLQRKINEKRRLLLANLLKRNQSNKSNSFNDSDNNEILASNHVYRKSSFNSTSPKKNGAVDQKDLLLKIKIGKYNHQNNNQIKKKKKARQQQKIKNSLWKPLQTINQQLKKSNNAYTNNLIMTDKKNKYKQIEQINSHILTKQSNKHINNQINQQQILFKIIQSQNFSRNKNKNEDQGLNENNSENNIRFNQQSGMLQSNKFKMVMQQQLKKSILLLRSSICGRSQEQNVSIDISIYSSTFSYKELQQEKQKQKYDKRQNKSDSSRREVIEVENKITKND